MSDLADPPWGLIVTGAVVTGIAAVLMGTDAPALVPFALYWLGGVLTAIGVVGTGVSLGLRHAHQHAEH